MKLKQYISIFILFIFLGKLGMMDGKFYGILLSGEHVTFVNKLCPKKHVQAEGHQDIAESFLNIQINLDYVCHAPVVLQFQNWEWPIKESNYRKFIYQTPGLFSALQKRDDPPPRV